MVRSAAKWRDSLVIAMMCALFVSACAPVASPSPSSASPSANVNPSASPSANTNPSTTPSVAATPSFSPVPLPSPSPTAPPRPTATPSPIGDAAPLFFRGPRTKKVIAITIDDGFSASAVMADLAILEQGHINATWFPIGHVVANDPEPWRAVAAAGFPIANHTWDHANLTHYSYARIVADIEHDNKTVSAIIGEPLLPVMRPPGGAWNETVLQAAAAAGQRAVVIWDASTGDTASLPSRANVDLLVRNATKGGPGSIILMHANLPYTQEALPRIIAYYQAKGFTFVTLGQMFGIPGPVPFPPAD